MGNFEFYSRDIDIAVSVKCSTDPLGGYPNQGDLRKAIDSLLSAVVSWDDVEITIKKHNLFSKLPEDIGPAYAQSEEK